MAKGKKKNKKSDNESDNEESSHRSSSISRGKKRKSVKLFLKDYEFLTLEEVRAREMKYTEILVYLRECMNYIDEAYLDVEEEKQTQLQLDEWDTYLRCDGLPKPEIPPDMRTFFTKLRYFEEEDLEQAMCWLLAINERSILTQDIFRVDKTRKELVKLIRPHYASAYEQNIEKALAVISNLEYLLDDHTRVSILPPSILLDLIEVKKMVHSEVREFFNRLSYRILSNENAFMENVDALTADYTYVGKSFEIHIWTIKNVPIRFNYLPVPMMRANMGCIKVRVQLPFSVLEDNLTLRGLHLHFDHNSEYAKSYEQQISADIENLNAGISAHDECLVNEWSMQIDLQKEIRALIIRRRLEFEEKRALQQAEEEAREKQRKKDGLSDVNKKKKDKDKDKKPKKVAKEPQIIEDNMYPDIWEDFLEKENDDYIKFMDTVFHPNVLDLNEYEINLKQYIMLGGIYELYFVNKSRNYNFETFNMTWHENDGNLFIRDDVNAVERHLNAHSLASLHNARSSIMRSRLTGKTRSEIFDTDAFDNVEDDFEVSPFFIVIFELPEYLCYWGEPMPCHYEDDAVAYRKRTNNETSSTKLVADERQETEEASAFEPEKIHDDFHLQPLSSSSNLYRKTSTFSLNLARLTQEAHLGKMNFFFDNFLLGNKLTKGQIDDLVKHCLPRMISSYKFTREKKTEETDETRVKTKGKGGTLVRRQRSIAETENNSSDRIFSFENQNNPERLFPQFPKQKHLMSLANTPHNEASRREPQSFAELLLALDVVKRDYENRHRTLLNVPAFKPNYIIKRTRGSNAQRSIFEGKRQGRKSARDGLSRKSRMSRKSASSLVSAASDDTRSEIVTEEHRTSVPMTQLLPDTMDEKAEIVEHKTSSEGVDEKNENDNLEEYTYAHWTKEYIYDYTFDRKTRLMTVYTDRLGTLGFAFKRYEHLPFQHWSIEPSEENPEHEVILTLETQHVRCVINVTGDGYKGYVTDITKGYVRFPKMYLVIDKPNKDIREIKRRFREKNLNIFCDMDARFYIENGYFSEKHLSTEFHTYACIALHCNLFKFRRSDWNRLSNRRDVMLRFGTPKEMEENMVTARITPEGCTFVEITELCSNDLNEIKLQYTPTWRNLDFYADLHHMIVSINPAATDLRVQDANLMCSLKDLLSEIRLLSYS